MVRGVRTETHVRLVVRGDLDEGTVQRLRNVLGIHPAGSYRTTSTEEGKRNLGRLLGVAWLAWLLHRAAR